jgi:hypothetical protein
VLLYTAAGAGGAILIATVTGIVAIRERNAGQDRCVADTTGQLFCDNRGAELLRNARTTTHVASGFFVAGLAAGGIAALLYYQGRSKETATTPTVWLSPSSAGFAVEHAW